MSILTQVQQRLSLEHRGLGECLWDSFVPRSLREDEEQLRRSRLQIRFGWLGAIFGAVYASFYGAIDHWHGALIIVACSMVFACGPALLQHTGKLEFTGNLYSAVLLMGFSGLTGIEGGLHGHAIAWLASIPLCALLLLPIRHALTWCCLSFVTALTFGLMEVFGKHFPKAYPLQYDDLISTAGYAGLVLFLALLGINFERLRARSFLRMERALASLSFANQRLVKVNTEKDEFLKIAAHDLKNPLGGISGYAELLAYYNPPTKEQILDTSKTIVGLSQRMLNIVNNLLDAQRIEEELIEFKSERCPADPLLQGIVKNHLRSAEKKFIALKAVPCVPSICARGDEGAMQQILDNLISNAVKYSPSNTTVRCTVRETADGILFDVRDEGPGLSEEDQKRLFKKFARLGPQPTGGEGSHGLGLWIVQRMAHAMGGDVRCITAQGMGSTFSLVMPKWVNGAGHSETAQTSGLSALLPQRAVG